MNAEIVPLTVLAGVIGFVAHELTHGATAWLLGRRVKIDWRQLDCLFTPGSIKGTLLIKFAPILVGFGLAVTWLVAAQPINWPIFVGWAIYTLGGIRNDVLSSVRWPLTKS